MSDLSKITLPNGATYDLKDATARSTAGIYYGTCATAAATAAKVIELTDPTGFELKPGVMIAVKFSASNTASNVTLNVEGTGGKQVWYNNAVNTGSSNSIFGYANRHTYYVYDGTHWVWVNYGTLDGNSNTVPSAQCETAAGTAAKVATLTNHTLTANTYCHFNIRYANTYKGAITMNVDSSGAKAIHINGATSSASNYTLPAGTYIAFYNGTYWDFRTDGKLPASITGTVNGHSINADVPSDLNTKLANIPEYGTVGSNQNPIYFNNGDPEPIAFTWGVDEDQNVQVAWDGDAPEIVIPTTSALAISSGGTGATTAAGARSNLGLGSAATYNVVSTLNNDSNLPTGAAIKNYIDGTAVPSAISTTIASTANKVATCSSYTAKANSYIQVILANSNTSKTALTLNINGQGAKPIYINDAATSSSNYTLPAGSYFVFYNGTNYYFRTDEKMQAIITGTASNVRGRVEIANGGTGATTVAGARNNLGLGNTSGALPIANGGTGATTASEARTSLGLGAASTQAIANNLTTSAEGSVLDARMGLELANMINDRITNKMQILSAMNATTYTITLKSEPSSSHNGIIVIFNANQSTAVMVNASSATSGNGVAIYGTKTFAWTRSGKIFTITPSTTMWGVSLIIVAEN